MFEYTDEERFLESPEIIGQAEDVFVDSLTYEDEIRARDMRIEDLERLCDSLARGYDEKSETADTLGAVLAQYSDELEATREALRLVIRKQIDER